MKKRLIKQIGTKIIKVNLYIRGVFWKAIQAAADRDVIYVNWLPEVSAYSDAKQNEPIKTVQFVFERDGIRSFSCHNRQAYVLLDTERKE